MELITLAALLCQGALCQERVIADSDHIPLTYVQCQIQGQQGIAQWLSLNPKYEGWEVKKWYCIQGKYVPKVGA